MIKSIVQYQKRLSETTKSDPVSIVKLTTKRRGQKTGCVSHKGLIKCLIMYVTMAGVQKPDSERGASVFCNKRCISTRKQGIGQRKVHGEAEENV